MSSEYDPPTVLEALSAILACVAVCLLAVQLCAPPRAAYAQQDQIFADGFESGDLCAWGGDCAPRCPSIKTYWTSAPTLSHCELGVEAGDARMLTVVRVCDDGVSRWIQRDEVSWRFTTGHMELCP